MQLSDLLTTTVAELLEDDDVMTCIQAGSVLNAWDELEPIQRKVFLSTLKYRIAQALK